ncbi:SDR family oxidoreductase [Streptomyces sp. TRM70350]|uniref:SDR family oxidoreductase n=1 Tax=Streptomyces sp. TRM70350 TaxID=2856165 RepID=UPI001C47E90D|nr:SDR family oxidoreductase [Streptomyces sp. TRM70350]MBV7696600.1 SDR family oxidoreductase [Streptomyces sp. TRM70350]
MLSGLTGSTAVVTGVGGRLGRVWTRALLRAGADVFGLDRVKPDDVALAEFGECTQGAAGRFVFHYGDVTDRPSLQDALGACLDRLGPPGVLVNNAGIDQPPSADAGSWLFEDIPEELSCTVLDVNAVGVLRTCQVFGTEMARRGSGSVINIGSLYGTVAPDPRFYDHIELDPPFLKPPAYGMSKAGVAALTRYLAAFWGPSGVRVNTLSPGGVLGGQDPRFREKFVARVPLGRMATEDDLVGPLLFLASDMSRYVTGTELLVDGGFVCW